MTGSSLRPESATAAGAKRATGSFPSTPRHTASRLRLLRASLGEPRQALGKGVRLARLIDGYRTGDELHRKLHRLHELGIVEQIPTPLQLAVGAIDMMRFFIHPAAADYYRRQGIGYWFHQTLRFLDEPASLVDPLGFFSTEDGIIGHLMQVVHANPRYDLELLSAFDHGLDHLEQQLAQMLDGTHPRAPSIGAIVEESDYHRSLLAHVRAWRADRRTPPLLRKNLAGNDRFAAPERTFGSLTTSMRYFCCLPRNLSAALGHLTRVHEYPAHLGEPPPPGAGTTDPRPA